MLQGTHIFLTFIIFNGCKIFHQEMEQNYLICLLLLDIPVASKLLPL